MERHVFFIMRIAFAAILVTSICQAQTSLPAAKVAQLKRLGLHWLRPAYLPIGFKLKSMTLQETQSKLEAYGDLTYTKPGTKEKIVIQFASDGLGDIFFPDDGSTTLPKSTYLKFRSIALGSGTIEHASGKGWDTTMMQWQEIRPNRFPKFVSVIADFVKPAEVKRVIESLRFIG